MNLLEVKNISKTYGSGETAVKALKMSAFLFQRANMWQSSANPAPAKAPAEHDRRVGHADFRQGAD